MLKSVLCRSIIIVWRNDTKNRLKYRHRFFMEEIKNG